MGLFGFGKRQPAAAPARPAHIHPSQPQLLPGELWQGELGDLLRAVGKSPDDESNFAPTAASIDARMARDKALHEEKWAQLNLDVGRRTNGGGVRPLFLIPEPCWNGELGTFLLAKLRLSPYEDWNVAFLAADAARRAAAV